MNGHLLSALPAALDAERFETLARSGGGRVERIVSHGQASPPGFWHEQDEDEFVLLVSGEAELGFDDGKRLTLTPGAWAWLPAGCRHRVERTAAGTDTVWLAVFFGAA